MELMVYLVKYVFVYLVCRIIWIIIVCTSTGLFMYLTFDKLNKLLSRPKSVNFEVNYPDYVPFPAVTICNANKYRYRVVFCVYSLSLSYYVDSVKA